MDKSDIIFEKLYEQSLNDVIGEYNQTYLGHTDDKILNTEETRFMLHYALQNVKNKILISSPWIYFGEKEDSVLDMSTGYLPNQLYDNYRIQKDMTIRKELKEIFSRNPKTDVYLSFGFSGETSDKNSLYACKKIIRIFPDITLLYRQGNHQKMILMDDDLLILGSYNFLSFPGKTVSKVGDREEKSYLTCDKKIIQKAWDTFHSDCKLPYTDRRKLKEINYEDKIDNILNSFKKRRY